MNKDLASVLNKINTHKIKGKKVPIQMGNRIYKIKEILSYNRSDSINAPIGLEFLLILGEQKYNRGHKGRIGDSKNAVKKVSFIGKVVARESSDIISMIANNIIREFAKKDLENSTGIKIIQYPLNYPDQSRKLVILKEIDRNIVESDYRNLELVISEISLEIRKAMKKIAESTIDTY